MRKIETLMNRAILDGQNWASANTRVEYENDDRISRVYLHGNKIAEVGETWIRLYDGGWQSATTKSRLNSILQTHSNGDGIYQKNFKWYVYDRQKQESQEFVSGMILN